MENLRVCANSYGESKEIQELFFDLGYKWISSKTCITKEKVIYDDQDGDLSSTGTHRYKFKTVTIQDLKDMVVLKRNDVGDATHYDSHISSEIIKCILIGEWWNTFTGGKWQQHCHVGSGRARYMKPIKEEVMKEYLEKQSDGSYRLYTAEPTANYIDGWIEVPEGADIALNAGGSVVCFYKGFNSYFNGNDWRSCKEDSIKTVGAYIDYGATLVWQREKESIIDKLVMDEVKHSHYKKDVSHLNVIDPYRIADLYDLHPCADHIMKKSLCTGNRGHKDTLRDIQDIIDTAERWKQMIKEDNNEI